MKVEVLYVTDCPSHPPAVRLLKDVLAAEGIKAEITEVLVVDAQMASELKFRGSPTIRINGIDIAGESSDTGTFACRLYPGSPQIGVPPIELVRRALTQARERRTP
jgi:protein-disulfide isomerase